MRNIAYKSIANLMSTCQKAGLDEYPDSVRASVNSITMIHAMVVLFTRITGKNQ